MYTMPFLGTYACILEGKQVHFRREHEVLKELCHDSFNITLKSWKIYWKQRNPKHNGSSFSLPIDQNNE